MFGAVLDNSIWSYYGTYAPEPSQSLSARPFDRAFCSRYDGPHCGEALRGSAQYGRIFLLSFTLTYCRCGNIMVHGKLHYYERNRNLKNKRRKGAIELIFTYVRQ
jgi:hypothetical protein